MSQFLFAPVVENARSLSRSALPDSPVVEDGRPTLARRTSRTSGAPSTRRLSFLPLRTKQATSYRTSPAL